MSDIQRGAARVFAVLSIMSVIAGSNWLGAVVTAQQYDASLYSELHWRMIGPFRGGRMNAVSGVPGQLDTYYFGSVGGGVWKTMNSGRTWTPVFDSQPVASIGAIGVAPSSPETAIIYLTTPPLFR